MLVYLNQDEVWPPRTEWSIESDDSGLWYFDEDGSWQASEGSIKTELFNTQPDKSDECSRDVGMRVSLDVVLERGQEKRPLTGSVRRWLHLGCGQGPVKTAEQLLSELNAGGLPLTETSTIVGSEAIGEDAAFCSEISDCVSLFHYGHDYGDCGF